MNAGAHRRGEGLPAVEAARIGPQGRQALRWIVRRWHDPHERDGIIPVAAEARLLRDLHQISPEHIHRYVAELQHRHNESPFDTIDQMSRMVKNMDGGPLRRPLHLQSVHRDAPDSGVGRPAGGGHQGAAAGRAHRRVAQRENARPSGR